MTDVNNEKNEDLDKSVEDMFKEVLKVANMGIRSDMMKQSLQYFMELKDIELREKLAFHIMTTWYLEAYNDMKEYFDSLKK